MLTTSIFILFLYISCLQVDGFRFISKTTSICHKSIPFEKITITLLPLHLSGVPVDQTSTKNSKFLTIFNKLYLQSKQLMNRWKDKETRTIMINNFTNDCKLIYKTLTNNTVNPSAEAGKRGEEILLVKVLLISLLILGIPEGLIGIIKLFGISSWILGFYLLLDGIWHLKSNLSFYNIPIQNNYLVTSGVYDMVRHPIYGGIMLLAIGSSIVCGNLEKLVISIFLTVLLVIIHLL